MAHTHICHRTIRFADVDAAGFVYFAHYLAFCHEAYEESLQRAGLELRAFFVANQCLVPIAKCQAQFLGALQSGDKVRIELTPSVTGTDAFTLSYRIFNQTAQDKLVGVASTEHVCLDLKTLARRPLPAEIARWLENAPCVQPL